MKKLLLCLLLGMGLQQYIFAQAITAPQNFESLKLNSSPAFVLLGIEPDNIQRPSSPSQFVAGLQNAVVDGKLQPNLAFEISPYYLANPKDPNIKRFQPMDYLLGKKNVWQTMVRTLSVSLATSPTDQQVFGNLKPGTGIGWGIRTQIIDGKPADTLRRYAIAHEKYAFFFKLQAMVNSYMGPTPDMSQILDQAIQVFKDQVLPAQNIDVMSDAEWQKFLDKTKQDLLYKLKAGNVGTDKASLAAWVTNLATQYQTVRDNDLQDLNKSVNPLTKTGFMLELALGQALVFQESNFNEDAFAKSAFWLTPSYRWDVSNGQQINLVDVMGVVRYTINNQSAGVDVANYVDAGLKGAVTKGNWSGSLEYIYRYASNTPAGQMKNYTYRLTAGIDYKITDQITFKFNFGTNFDGNTTTYSDPKKIFALGGLNFGLPGISSTKAK